MKIKFTVLFLFFCIIGSSQIIIPISSGFRHFQIAPDGRIHIVSRASEDEIYIETEILDLNTFSIQRCGTSRYEPAHLVFPRKTTSAIVDVLPNGTLVCNFNENCESSHPNTSQNKFEWIEKTTANNGKIYCISDDGKLLTVNEKSIVTRRDSLQIPSVENIEFMKFNASGNIKVTNFSNQRIYEVDTLGEKINEFIANLPVGKYFHKEDKYYSLGKNSDGSYLLSGVDSIGTPIMEVTLKDTCEKCFYYDFIINGQENVYLVGGVYHSRSAIPQWNRSGDRDVVVSEFKYSGELKRSKFADNKLFSEALGAYLTKDREVLLFSIWNKNDNIRSLAPSVIIKTDLDLTGFSDLTYQFPDTVTVIDTTLVDTMMIDTIIIIDTLPTGEEITFLIGPNPAREFFKIKSNLSDKKIRFTLRDLQGVLVREETFFDELIINTDNIVKGVFFYSLKSPDKQFEIYKGRIIVYK